MQVAEWQALKQQRGKQQRGKQERGQTAEKKKADWQAGGRQAADNLTRDAQAQSSTIKIRLTATTVKNPACRSEAMKSEDRRADKNGKTFSNSA